MSIININTLRKISRDLKELKLQVDQLRSENRLLKDQVNQYKMMVKQNY